MNDILIMWCVVLYLVMGILVSFLIVNMVCKNNEFNKWHYSVSEYADEHAFEVFIMMILWPIYVLMVVVTYTFVTLWKWFNKR